jgi:isopenicillin N synthase-like dioxygenase
MSVEIPVVDISPWINCSEKEIRDHFSGLVISKILQDVAEKWDYSFSHHGFAVIVGHGLLSNDMDNLEGEMSSFFGLEKEKKMKYCNGSYGSEDGG